MNISPEETKKHLDEIASALLDQRQKLLEIIPSLSGIDALAMREITTELAWSAENCTVVGLHQIGEAQHDRMGL